MRAKTCCFTGHRDLPIKDILEIAENTENQIKALIQRGVKFFGVGGALGYDTQAAEILMRLRDQEHYNIKIILVAPFPDFTGRWTKDEQDHFNQRLLKYNKIVYTSQTGSREAYLRRDRHLVDFSGYCISYCTRDTGGTAYTLKYAREQGIEIYNVADMMRSRK